VCVRVCGIGRNGVKRAEPRRKIDFRLRGLLNVESKTIVSSMATAAGGGAGAGAGAGSGEAKIKNTHTVGDGVNIRKGGERQTSDNSNDDNKTMASE